MGAERRRQPDPSFLPWIPAYKVHDIAFSGQGTLEGDTDIQMTDVQYPV